LLISDVKICRFASRIECNCLGGGGRDFVSLEAPPIGGIMLCKASIWGQLWFEGPTTTDFSYFLPVPIGFYIVKVVYYGSKPYYTLEVTTPQV